MPLVSTRGGASASGLGWSAVSGPPPDYGSMVLVQPTSINYSGTSASIVGEGSVQFSACTELRLNGVFKSAYDNYVITWRGTTNTSTAVGMRLSSGGTDDTSSNYTTQLWSSSNTTRSASRSTSQNLWTGLTYSYNVQTAAATYYMYGPYLAEKTAVRTVTVTDYASATIEDTAGTHGVASSYDGFNFYLNTNNANGVISVYGLVS